MPFNEVLKQYPIKVGEKNYFSTDNQDTALKSINTETFDRINFNSDKVESHPTAGSVILITPILFVLTTTAIIFYRLKRVEQDNAPCKSCQFFNNNNYLKCAVNPAEVLTAKAKDCREYCPQPKKLFGFSRKPREKN
jgi:hypothetical protein